MKIEYVELAIYENIRMDDGTVYRRSVDGEWEFFTNDEWDHIGYTTNLEELYKEYARGLCNDATKIRGN